MRQDIFGDTGAALRNARSAGILSNPLGLPPHKYITGAGYVPHFAFHGATFNTGINRCYYTQFHVWLQKTFAGVRVENTGAGDNTEKIRIMVFRDDGAIGGPGTLEKDFGEITLTAAAALRTLSSSWAATPAPYWMAVWHETAAAMYGFTPYNAPTNAGGTAVTFNLNASMGRLTAAFGTNNNVVCHYVDTAYGAAPATAVAPTASLSAAPHALTGICTAWELVG